LQDCRVDLTRQRVIRGDVSISLTTMERRLLEYLINHVNEVVTREALLENVWEYSASAQTHTVRTTVNRLRAKIERDPSDPVHLQTIRGTGYQLHCEVEASPEETSGSSTNLEVLPGLFVGRAVELARLKDLLSVPRALVTLRGLGGIGKTTLALRFAASQVDACPGGVWFCELTGVRSAQGVGEVVVRALGVDRVEDDVAAQVVRLLAHRPATLIVLDNFEQVVDAAATLVQAWRRATPNVRWLVTSRHQLGVASEQVLPLGVLSGDDATTLYLERARERVPTWSLEPTKRDALARLMDLLEGIPLAIDLAAGRASVLPPETLCERLAVWDDGALRSRQRDRPERHHTIQATLELSWHLLEPHEQQAVAQLCVFSDGFRLDAAEAVLDLPPEHWIADLLEGLLEKSWVHRVETAAGVRFRCLEVVRRFGLTKLTGLDADDAVRLRHARFFGREGRQAFFGMRARAPFPERGNLLAALEKAVTAGWVEEAVDLAVKFGRGCHFFGPLAQGQHWVLRVLDLADHTVENASILVLLDGMLLSSMGDLVAAEGRYEEALAMAPSDPRHLARGLINLGGVLKEQGRFEEAHTHYETALEVTQGAGLRMLEMSVHGNLGNLYGAQGRIAESRAHLEAALAHCHALDDGANLGLVSGNLAVLLHGQGQTTEARRHLETALTQARAYGYRRFECYVLGNLGEICRETGHLDASRTYLDQALAMSRAVGDRRQEAHLLGQSARLGALLGGGHELLAKVDHGEAILREVGATELLGHLLATRAEILYRLDDLFGAAASLEAARAAVDEPMQELASMLDEVQQLIDTGDPAS